MSRLGKGIAAGALALLIVQAYFFFDYMHHAKVEREMEPVSDALYLIYGMCERGTTAVSHKDHADTMIVVVACKWRKLK